MKDHNAEYLKAFVITTKNNNYGEDRYVVIAYSFSEAEEIYWEQLGGYHDITNISVIDAKEVGYHHSCITTEH